MVFKYNEKGVTLIEGAFVLMLFCFIFTLSVYYIHLTMIVSKSLSLGQTMNTLGSHIEFIIKSGKCECKFADDICKKCLENEIMNSDLIKKLNQTESLRVATRNLITKEGVGILIYPTALGTKNGTFFTSLDEIYFTIAGTKEKAIIINPDSSITTPNKISFVIGNVIDNNKKLFKLSDFGIADTGPSWMYPGIYFEVPVH
ncbi:TPA: hypothetical protein J1184_004551 [Escherichia coli]|uniref:hypothetical protein n=1 Tax=Escherichia coli TaxID=562 RepID=UPI000BE185BE|nr:hypothetical protein [Escherichia coli]CAD5781056.1 Uncharacterised protein [Escherichia coli]CAD5794250.1 Uncharacterised protein [Escherichia coli]HBA7003919.1 hypothetical protein [Escherichia coli]HBA8669653.1 hypothetical protein [Escherichia coli]HBA8709965.1 hypothetical protein [Escherichia coli]